MLAQFFLLLTSFLLLKCGKQKKSNTHLQLLYKKKQNKKNQDEKLVAEEFQNDTINKPGGWSLS